MTRIKYFLAACKIKILQSVDKAEGNTVNNTIKS